MRVDHILENHSGTVVKTLKLEIPDYCKVDTCQLNRWLHIAITPGIEEVTLLLPENYMTKYSFPCSLLFGGCGNSIRYLRLMDCAFRPPVGFDCLRSLTKLHLYERVNTPMVADNFLNLKYLNMYLAGDYEAFSPAYDYLSLVPFLDASPALEAFILIVNGKDMKHVSVFGNASHMRQILGHKHDRLKKVQINGFCSAKRMVELTCHILENASSLESLTVNTIFDVFLRGVMMLVGALSKRKVNVPPFPWKHIKHSGL
ncbi:hypothetical protein BAE44_0009271 [Dichanthelium oligosanthes]|uniref:At1g61320/AtMIF1 LRR domain-containing protein n=1 Tax=Dichanthelium oligosanthes TaxID=888268 RepID=A0A1E5VX65_9POAL|nr:hypothetical protein BAE44_0009271 [Dichanthelium oligosanthes]